MTASWTPVRGLAVLLLTGFGVWLLAGVGWALIAGAGLVLFDLISDMLMERVPHGRADR